MEFLYGRRPVYEALVANRRHIRRVIVAEGVDESGTLAGIVEDAQAQGVRVERMNRRWLDQRVDGANHQGVLIEVGDYPYGSLADLLERAAERREPPLLLLLDLIQDVQNVGTLLRAAEAVGAHGVVIQERRAASVTPAVVSASSGAVEHLIVAREKNLVRAMEELKANDVWLYGLDLGEDAVRYDLADLSGSVGLVVGSEGEGLRRLVRETCDAIIYLPMRGNVESLNASVAGSIALFAAWQARGFAGEL